MNNSLAGDTILVPFDFSDQSKDAVETALEWAAPSTKVHVLFVLIPLEMATIDPSVFVDLGNEATRVENALKAVKSRIGEPPAASLHVEVRLGDPGLEIVAYASEIDASMIIMPSHGRTGIKRILLGSVAERVIRLAECPVMIVRKKRDST